MTSINLDLFRNLKSLPNLFAFSSASGLGLSQTPSYRRVLLASALIFLTAIGVRLLHWQDMQTQIETGKMHFGMVDLYRAKARLLLHGEYRLFVQGHNPPTNAEVLTHPPGHALWLAALFKLFGDSLALWRFAQILFDAFTVLGVFFFARELLPFGAATIAGILVAISPQVAYTSIVLLPDSLCILPLAWAMFLIARCYKRPNLWLIIFAGGLIGISCWFRPNAMLLPLFLVPLILLTVPRYRRWFAAALVATTVIVIAPMTLRNVIVFRVFVPITLGVGINLSEGIADYDDQNRFGLIQKDHLVNQWEAQVYNRPDYAHSLYGPDGIARDRERSKRALAVIKQNPVWFAGVMVRRVKFMMTFEQTPVVSPLPAVSHSLHITSQIGPAWSLLPGELVSPDYRGGPGIKFSEEGWLILENATATGSALFISQLVPLDPRMDHVLAMPVEITGGRFVVRLTDPDTRTLLASAAVPDVFQGLPADRPPSNVLQVPFVSLGKDRMMISIVGADNESVSGRVGPITLSQLGESSYTWTRAPRFVLRTFQKLFTTRKMWPGIFCGLTVLLIAGRWRQALTILIVPAYYYVVHSPIHTEYRYVVGNHYFLLIFAAVVVYWVGTILVRIFWLVRRDRRLKLSVR